MVAGPWCRPLGFSIGPVTPTVTNPSELIDGAYIVRTENEVVPLQHLGAIAFLIVESNYVAVKILTDENGGCYQWNGTSFIVADPENTNELMGVSEDLIRMVYNDSGYIIGSVSTEISAPPTELVAIIES